ncbi:MAG: hypothetical protein FJY80_12625, partial [Candidatus Aminicenantes bacterium]|nr:hypothetical protein [Candidatus Aminicenantes bacterium]
MPTQKLRRRHFLKTSAAAAFGAGWAGYPAERQTDEAAPRIRDYRTLGRTGFKVSDIAAGFIQDDGVIA